jgi:hypothetical protein
VRSFGFRIGAATSLHQAPLPGRQPTQSSRSPHRRLDDEMVAVFERACRINNLDAAGEVLELLEASHQRRSVRYGRERRIDDGHLTSMRSELKRLKATRLV